MSSTDPAQGSRASSTVLRPVVIAGGSGTRLWPLSREEYPKQLLQIRHTIDRAALAGSRLGQGQRDRMRDGCVTDANRVVTALSARGEL